MTKTVPGIAQTAIRSRRIESIDLLRGFIIVFMCLDHVRDYFHAYSYIHDPTDLQHTSAPIFLTRWITHYCAPVFTLLAGVAACLYGMKHDRRSLSFFLFSRGLWLVVLELVYVTLAWTFNPHYPAFILQVIWALGFSMMALALLIHLPRTVLLFLGLFIVFGHNALDGIHSTEHKASDLIWSLLHEPNFTGYQLGPFNLVIGYPVLPYIGIISLGYCLGTLYGAAVDPDYRKRILRNLGIGAIFLFVILRFIDQYGDNAHWTVQKNFLFTIFSFVNVSKYPPSLLFILMTLGPALLFLAYAERPLNRLTSKLIIFGKVPMFFYLMHIPLIHGFGVLAAMISGRPASDMVNFTTWVTANVQLVGYGFGLPVVYLMWLVTLAILYPLCLRFSKYKQLNQGKKKWLSYF
ncbi:DUF1624 domain-containing protein [Pseudobacter ginsenosidimutans]|uniref:Putative membrane protein n=1 Tax=Pseudobacter ginsenosidimutans TaxID=661488 RepID=A0A4Q7MYQ5_9BACT|nr:heparan-alpha-glucosaminide N-acetyltransferase domain-containing protein [Pseudobacter ginsenosidimutans]QEC40966.1 DUF1624 domain-containing protein [Pseudobacter ginsenosidimutans]RZS72290.1 putative membrane protein [Pseudobacter ginsenosidimutans]